MLSTFGHLLLQVYLTLAAVVAVILSAGACFGVGMASGFLFGAPHQALIFLLLGTVLETHIDIIVMCVSFTDFTYIPML